MDLGSQLIALVIFGLIGFGIGYFTGFNPYNLYGNVTSIILVVPLIFIILKISLNPSSGSDAINDVVKWYSNNIAGILIGDIAGSIVGSVVGEK